jgi:regulator of cell morphogenesis and NO signaling
MIAIQEKTIGEIAAESPAAIAVFERFGIDYCCGGRRPLADACKEAGITVGAFESALNAAPAAPELNLDWTARPLTDLHAYLVGRYHVHAREQLATLGTLAAKVMAVHSERHPEVRRVATLVNALEQDMLPHMTKEEVVLFPYVDSLESGEPQPCCFGTVQNPIRVMLAEHEAVGDILSNLRTTTSDYTPPEDACFSYRELYRRLADMERETHEHIHLENNVYFPRALDLERSL